MPGFERAATIDRPPAQVYAVLDDIRAAPNWMPAIRKIEVLTPDNAVDVGFRWRETRRVMGIFRMSAELEVAQHDKPRAWGLKFEDRKMRATATFTLTPSESGTLITLREDVEDLQGKPKRAERTAKWMEKSDDDLLLRLKAYVESQPLREDLVEPEAVHEPVDSEGVEPATPAARKPRKKAAKKPAKKTAKKAAAKRPAKKAKADPRTPAAPTVVTTSQES